MVDILHRVGVMGSSTDEVYRVLSTRDGLADWWTEQTQGESEVGSVLQFRFPAGGFDMNVTTLDPGKRVHWEVIDGPAEWVGTTVGFELKQEGPDAIVLFAHRGWREPVEFMHHCSTKWATFLLSLKALLETGKGAPSPNDVRVDNWD